MENWWEIAIGCAVVVTVSLLFDFASIPSGVGKLFAYLGTALFPTLIIQFQNMRDINADLKTGEFMFYLVLNTFLVLFFATIILEFVFGRS
ncbi:hypothetical protein J7K03_01570 [bacterium]|nr:hypothetical protein [bacterium]